MWSVQRILLSACLLSAAAVRVEAIDELVSDQFKDLRPFEVALVLQSSNVTVDDFQVKRITGQWMTEVFETEIENRGAEYRLVQTIMQDFKDAKQNGKTFSGFYSGMSIWKLDSDIPAAEDVYAMQLQGLFQYTDQLLDRLRDGSEEDGLGSNVVDVKTELIKAEGGDEAQPNPNNDDSLDVVIIVAIVIAVLAFLLLGFAIIMAWKQNRQRSAAFKADVNRDPNSPAGTGASDTEGSPRAGRAGEEEDHSPPPSEIAPSDLGGGLYPDSVISEDITTSLSAYYSSGMAKSHDTTTNRLAAGAGLNDAASVSSMESYGYSLDGYANSISKEP